MMRIVFYYISIIGLIATAAIYPYWPEILYFLIILIPYIILGLYDIQSKTHTILRNYPVIGHFRYMLEYIRPEIQQYFIETEHKGQPFSRETRSLVYQRAKNARDTIPFGTKHNITETGHEFSLHSLSPVEVSEDKARILIGGNDCKKPYSASLLNISAMSFGALSPNAILALNKGAKLGGFFHNTGEGGISPYHKDGGGDIVWQIGTGYFGCRRKDGGFDKKLFKEKATLDCVKMIEIKLSQGAKPAHGGILPAAKVNQEIADIRSIETCKDANSPPSHSEFSTPEGLLQFVADLRKMSGGKPVGFKLCIGIRKEFMAICKAMIKTGITPDFITVDGAEGGTGAAPVAFTNRIGTPINESISFVHNCLVGINMRDRIKLIASGKITNGYDMVTKIALGADICNAARAMMFALGCVQSLHCNTNKCPTGIATQDRRRWKLLDVEDKYVRVANYHQATINGFLQLIGAMGIEAPEDLTPELIKQYTKTGSIKDYSQIYPQLEAGELISGSKQECYANDWNLACSDSFR